ncbi:hypothetical protein SAMN04487969_11986 [Paenibacillus algorifonticola]|uniref:Uncharacterized protein n=1 Tax=Paenibacillus algorifonticola TaxID=684063 RepID=A0A1I2GZT2_9BACL|nr:hypothetical protein [Paenibacillus algorifonticola]SFF23305.1 hypothetical protein SAMN04487969_11986 [Paenibacillus algorifonticola]
MPDIQKFSIHSGRIIGEDGNTVNLVDLIRSIGGGGGGGSPVTPTQHTFQNAAIEVGDGIPLVVGNKSTLIVEITGTATSRMLEFKALGPSGAQYALMGSRVSDYTPASSTTGGTPVTGEMWEFGIQGLNTVIIRVSAVTGGNVTVKGTVI